MSANADDSRIFSPYMPSLLHFSLVKVGVLKLEDDECTFHWRSDGTIDEIKTVEHLVVNANINIRKRFDLAGMYCLEDSIKTLWVEMQVSGQRRFWASFNLMVFWKRRMRNATRVPWARAALAYLGRFPEFSIPRFSSLFPLLLLEERQKFLEALNYAEDDDLRVCAHAMTKDEEEHICILT
ncbi:hypothetical protein AVEN_183829-1 [Araneus ventricosus]|uniref:Uncharacterized protein n=1 Tax=Araneus ventricosus TaxID=182803 RepID=A0A4Y2N6M9_ARAVE|nr:hypothetical protein AVEN_183829-1 [Araneus ventricosus]